MFSSILTLGLVALRGVYALPTGEVSPAIERRGTVLSASQLAAVVPYAQFARAAYCPTSVINGWKCGEACDALPGFNPTLVGGDGNAIQIYFVGYWPQGNTIIVGHEGTDPTKLQADLTDVNILMAAPSTTLFPGIPSNVLVHQGFRDQHAKTAQAIFAEVQRLISTTGAKRVTTVGHSLGGALSILDGLSLRLRLPSSVAVAIRTFGAPRVGTPEFVSFFDTKISDLQRVNNRHDLIPIIPGRFLGFAHPGGEIHILEEDKAVSCAGDDNASDSQCTISSVPNIFAGNIIDHLGDYQGVYMGTIFCY